nr:NUDIX domain-containing protein [Pseudomonas sp.]
MNFACDTAIYIGRFQPFLNTHLAQVRHALTLAPRCLVVIAGARQARSPRNPLSRQQRADLIDAALSPDEKARVHIVATRDDNDAERWSLSVRAKLFAAFPDTASSGTTIVVCEPGCRFHALTWAMEDSTSPAAPTQTPLREQLYEAGTGAHALLQASSLLAPGTEGLIDEWLSSDEFSRTAEEWQALKSMRAEWDGSPYTPIFVTVDAVVRCAGHVLLIRRGHQPGKGLYALPGGFLEAEEPVLASAIRELAEETGLNVTRAALHKALRQVKVFDDPWRSQLGRVLTHAHFFDLPLQTVPTILAGDDAAEAFWTAEGDLAGLEEYFHDDHFLILDHFLRIIRSDDTQPDSVR